MMRYLGLLETKSFCCGDCTYAQCHAMVEVGKEKSLSLVELAARLNVDKSFASRTVDELVKKGFLCRKQDPTDRRYVQIALTEYGNERLKEIEVNSRQIYEQILDTIPLDKQEVVLSGLQIFNEALRKTATR